MNYSLGSQALGSSHRYSLQSVYSRESSRVSNMGSDPPERAQWGRQAQFILTLVGYAVGLGNVWRFPYLCYKNGGGAFLIPYVICLIFLGIPVFALEVAFGQFGGKGPISIWYVNPALKGIGYAGALVSACIAIYYDVIIAWGLYYLFASMTDEVPWAKCTSCACLADGKNITLGYDNATQLNCTSYTGDTMSASEVYYREVVLEVTDSIADPGELNWKIMLCNLLAWLVVLVVLSKGIQSLGKVVYFTATFPYLLLTILLVRGALLDGALEGIKFYLTPDWNRLTDAQVWSDAAVQIFFSLSACQGGLVAMASYNKFSNNVLRDSLMVPIINCLTSFYAGFVVFSTLGYMAHVRGVSVANVTASGPGLAFVAYPEALSNMPITPLWSILFFFMLCTLGFSSQFSIVETVMTAIIDEFPRVFKSKKRTFLFRMCICIGAFVLGLPMCTQGGSYLLDLADTYILGFPTLFIAFFELIALCIVYGYSNFAKDIEAMVGRKPFLYFHVCWVFLTPLLILAVIVFKAIQYEPLTDKGDPVWAEVIGWLIALSPVALVPIVFFWKTCSNGIWQRLKELNSPEPEWTLRRTKSTHPQFSDYAFNIKTLDAKSPMNEKTHGGENNLGYVPHEKETNEYDVKPPVEDKVPYSVDPEKYLTNCEDKEGYTEEFTRF